MTLQLPKFVKQFTTETPLKEPPTPDPRHPLRYPRGYFPGTLYLEVTAKHIYDAYGGAYGCPIALAAKELFGHPGYKISAAEGKIVIMDAVSPWNTLAYYRGEPGAKKFMDNFDQTYPYGVGTVSPATFVFVLDRRLF